MAELKVVKVSDKGQLEITKTEDVIYIIENSINLTVKEGVNAKILDLASDAEINVTAEANSYLEYFILESKNSKRDFKVAGDVRISEIGLETTNENLKVSLTAENANFDSKCLSFASKITSEFHSYVEHNAKYTYSNIANIGVAMEGGNLLFDVVGKIEKGRSKSKCAQLSRGIVMDNDSRVDAKPILLIDEYDCFANHGASIGKVSDEDLFYLMSRGLTKTDACLLILEGVVRPFIDRIPLEDYKNLISEKVSHLM